METEKKKFPIKKLLTVIGALLVVVVLGFLVKTLFFKNTNIGSGGEIVWWGLWEDDAS